MSPRTCVLDCYYDERYSSGLVLRWPYVYEASARIVRDFDVRTPSVFALAGNLSGGNQQKLVVGRELSREIKLMIAAQPTRGVDVGSIEYIHKRRSSRRATPASGCSSSRPNSTRSGRSPTASW